MKKDYHTTDMKPNESKTKDESSVQQKPKEESKKPKIRFHFSGGGTYAPISIEAESREEAERLWRERRVRQQ